GLYDPAAARAGRAGREPRRGRAVAEALQDHLSRSSGALRLAPHPARARPASPRRACDQGSGRSAGARDRRPRPLASASPTRSRGHAALHAHQSRGRGGGCPACTCRRRGAVPAGGDRPLARRSRRPLEAGVLRGTDPGSRRFSRTNSHDGGLAMTHALELRQVSKIYGRGPNEVHALLDVDLTVERGELVAIMGPSGSGKSTLLTIAGSLENPTSGQVLVDEVDLSTVSRSDQARMRRRSIGYVFQDFNLLPGLKAIENVTLPLELDGVGSRAARTAAIEAMEELDVADRADRFPDELSGGERQRVAIARAIVGKRGLLLADEPTGALDSVNGEAAERPRGRPAPPR